MHIHVSYLWLLVISHYKYRGITRVDLSLVIGGGKVLKET